MYHFEIGKFFSILLGQLSHHTTLQAKNMVVYYHNVDLGKTDITFSSFLYIGIKIY